MHIAHRTPQRTAPHVRRAATGLLDGVPSSQLGEAQALLDDMAIEVKKAQASVAKQDPDGTSLHVNDVLKSVSKLELLQAPGLAFVIPKEYTNLPRLTGRAVVELTIGRSGAGADNFVDEVNGGRVARAKVQLTLDGYSAPISAGNFAANVQVRRHDATTAAPTKADGGRDGARVAAYMGYVAGFCLPIARDQQIHNVPSDSTPLPLPASPLLPAATASSRWSQDGLYNGRPLSVSFSSIYASGPPTRPRPPIPLEILPAGEFDPVYRLPLDVQVLYCLHLRIIHLKLLSSPGIHLKLLMHALLM